jgi:hypothetical protein
MEKGANWKNTMTNMLGLDPETDIYKPGEPLKRYAQAFRGCQTASQE